MADKRWVSTSDTNWTTAANWLPTNAPAGGDNITFENNSVACGVTTLTHTTAFGRLDFDKSYTGLLASATGYMAGIVSVSNLGFHFGSGSPPGSQRIVWDYGTASATITIFDSASAGYESNLDPIRLLMNHTATSVIIKKGKVGIATGNAAETATLGTVNLGYTSNQATDGQVTVGQGTTLTTYNQTGGVGYLGSGCTTVNMEGGTLTKSGSGAVTTANIRGGTTNYGGSGAVTTMEVADGATCYLETTGTITTLRVMGTVDMTRMAAARTISNPVELYKGCTFKYDPAFITLSAGFKTIKCSLDDVTIVCGNDKTYTQA